MRAIVALGAGAFLTAGLEGAAQAQPYTTHPQAAGLSASSGEARTTLAQRRQAGLGQPGARDPQLRQARRAARMAARDKRRFGPEALRPGRF